MNEPCDDSATHGNLFISSLLVGTMMLLICNYLIDTCGATPDNTKVSKWYQTNCKSKEELHTWHFLKYDQHSVKISHLMYMCVFADLLL